MQTVAAAPAAPSNEPWPRDIAAVLARCPVRRYRRGEVIITVGSPDTTMHFVDRGRIALTVADEQHGARTRAIMGPGSLLGTMALLRPGTLRVSTAVAFDAVETFALSRGQFEQLRRLHPELERFVYDHVAGVIAQLDRQVLDATTLRAEQRVLRQLVALVPAFRSGNRSIVRLRQEDLASMSGTTRPTVNQVLRAVEADGLIRLGRNRIDVLDLDALAERSR
jgi:CRP/FNR family cyclic AMP-dependent transcriptional regulator